MTESELLAIRRAAGAVLRPLRHRGSRPGQPLGGDPVPPSLAIDAVLAAMGARFSLAADAVQRLLRPALADWRDAVGCADPLFLPANAAAEPQLIPLPLPSWCAALIDAGVLRCEGPARIEGPRVVLQASLAVVREAELSAVEHFPVLFAGRYTPGALHLHLALSPPFLARSWRGPVCLRAGAHRPGPAPRIWLGAPATPAGPAPGESGEAATTWVVEPGSGDVQQGWPAGWPRWAVLRLLEGREPQALWHLPALWAARLGATPESGCDGSPGAAVAMRLALDLGSTSTVVIEEESAASGAPGTRLFSGRGARRMPSGFRRLAGDPLTAHRFGCAEDLLSPEGQLPTALAAASPEALSRLLGHGGPTAGEQVWLPQASSQPDAEPAAVFADRFKSPDLLLLSEWLSRLPGGPALDAREVSRKLLETYGRLLGVALAASHAAPLVIPQGGGWTLRWPRLEEAEAVLTFPLCAWSAGAEEPFQSVFEGVAAALCGGLSSAWTRVAHRLVPDPVAARSAAGEARASSIQAFVDFGGLTVQVTVGLPETPGRPAPFLRGSSMTYLLGGERFINAASYAAADLVPDMPLRDAFGRSARRWRELIAQGGHAAGDPAAAAVRDAIAGVVLEVAARQIEATVRRAAPDFAGLRGAPLTLFLLGEGWKLAALDAPAAQREAGMLRVVQSWLQERAVVPGARVELVRIDKSRLCEGALRAEISGGPAETALELQGVDVASRRGLEQRWFAVAGQGGAAIGPHGDDPWWRAFAPGDGLLRMEQWFSVADHGSPFGSSLAGGAMAFDARRSVLRQWLDVCGASLLALRMHASLEKAAGRPG